MTEHDKQSQDRLAQLLALAINLEPVLFDKVLTAATVDDLTGAYNQTFFRSGLANELNRAKALRYPLGVILVSPAPPDEISAEIQELLIDKALRSAAAELVVISRNTDWTARSDTHELALVLPGCPVERLKQLGAKIAERIQPLEIRLANGDSHQLDMQIGAACHLTGADDVDQLLRLAREALQQDSLDGRITVGTRDSYRWNQGIA